MAINTNNNYKNKIYSSTFTDVEEPDLVTVSIYSEPCYDAEKVKDIQSNSLDINGSGIPFICEHSNSILNNEVLNSVTYNANDIDPIYDKTEKDEETIFERVQATIKKDIYNKLECQNKYEILNSMKINRNKKIQIYELEHDELIIEGCLEDLLYCQTYIKYCLNQNKKNHHKPGKVDFLPNCNSDNDKKSSESRNNIEATSENIKPKPSSKLPNSELSHYTSFQINDRNGNTDVEDKDLVRIDEQIYLPKEDNNNYSCNMCSFRCSRRNHLLKHKIHHQKNVKIHSCSLCSYRTIRLSQLTKHKKYHLKCLSSHSSNLQESNLNPNVDRIIVNIESDKINKQKKLAKKVNNSVHPSNKYLCKLCGYRGKHINDYKAHIQSYHPIKYCCSQCDYATYKRVHYIRHVRNVHENKRPYKCPHCHMFFKRLDAMKQHQVVHAKEKLLEGKLIKAKFRCEICNKTVRSASYLKEHMLTHSEERSFLCEICGASFKTRAVQRNHMKVVHNHLGKPFCQTCGKFFSTKFSLNRHMNQHGIG